MFKHLDEFIVKAKKNGKKRVVIAAAADDAVIHAAELAQEAGIATPIFVGDQKKIEKIAKEFHFSLRGADIINELSPELAAIRSVKIIRENHGDILMKGIVDSASFTPGALTSFIPDGAPSDMARYYTGIDKGSIILSKVDQYFNPAWDVRMNGNSGYGEIHGMVTDDMAAIACAALEYLDNRGVANLTKMTADLEVLDSGVKLLEFENILEKQGLGEEKKESERLKYAQMLDAKNMRPIPAFS